MCGLAIYIKKHHNAKRRIMKKKIKYFTLQKSTLQKKFSLKTKPPQNPSRYYYYNFIITNLKFQHKPKYHLSKILILKKIDLLLLLPRGL